MGLFTAHLFWGSLALAQRSVTSFGWYCETHLPDPPSSVLLLPDPAHGSSPTILAGSAESPMIYKYQMTGDSTLHYTGHIPSPFPVLQMETSDVNYDRKPEIIALSTDGCHLAIMRTGEHEGEVAMLELEQRCDRFIVADINNDSRPEILLFGRSMAGVATAVIPRGITPKSGPLLFPELSVSDMVATDLNGDHISDVVIAHWLSNRLLVRFGIGAGVFSEQSVLDLPAEPDRLCLTTLSSGSRIRILVTLPDARSVAHVVGRPSGEFAVRELISIRELPTGVRFASINDDAYPDMICSTRGGYAVALGVSSQSFAPGTQFGAGEEAASWIVGDANGDGKADLLFVQRPDRLAVLFNARTAAKSRGITTYAVGSSPAGILLGDFNGDGAVDIAAANAGSASLSILYNNRSEGFDGQVAIGVGQSPEWLHGVTQRTGTATSIIAAHPERSALSVVRLPRDREHARSFTIPTALSPGVLYAEEAPDGNGLKILVDCKDDGGKHAPATLIEQIEGNHFVERSFRWPQPVSVTAMTVGDLTGNFHGDLIMAVRETRSRNTAIVYAPSIEGFDYKRIARLFSLPDSLGIPRCLVAGRIDTDNFTDLAMILGPPANALGISFGAHEVSMTPPAFWIRDITPAGRPAPVLIDADGDGFSDLVYSDASDSAIKVLYGDGRGSFSAPAAVLQGGASSGFAIGQLFERDRNDLVISDSRTHTLTIHRGAFRR